MDSNFFITPQESVKTALKRLDLSAEKTLFVIDPATTLLGTISDGDIRRALLKGFDLLSPIGEIYHRDPTYVSATSYSLERVQKIMLERRISIVPIVNGHKQVVDMISWADAFGEHPPALPTEERLEIPVVVMAGGKGTRLAPFTSVLPKPLIPIGEKTVLELIMEEFQRYYSGEFYFTLNYKGEMIEAYFNSKDPSLPINYVWEKEFLGTAGSLKLLEGQLHSTFVLSNADIIVKTDYRNVLAFHKEKDADLTLLTSLQHHTLPYGIVEYKNGGEITGIREKPEYSYNIITGVYMMEPTVLSFIPEGQFFHMTHLIDTLMAAGKKVVIYPLNTHDYTDLGQWSHYQEAVQRLTFPTP